MVRIEEILHDLLDDKIKEIKSNPSILDQIFNGKPVDQLNKIKQWITGTNIKTVYHFPRDAVELPCYAIILDSSNESDQIIGMVGDQYDEVYVSNMEDGWIGSDSDILRENIYLSTDVKQFYNALEVKDGRRSCHLIGDKTTSYGKGVWIDFESSVLQGGYASLAGMGYINFWIKSNRTGTFLEFGFGENSHREHIFNFSVSVKNLWERITIDIRGVEDKRKDKIRYMSFTITNADEYTDVYIDALRGEVSPYYEYYEAYFDHRYSIESWTDNVELTLVLYEVAKWNILKYRKYLETSWGLIRQRLDGGDIMPHPEYYPEFVYIRSLGYNCSTVEIVPREEGVATSVEVRKIDFG